MINDRFDIMNIFRLIKLLAPTNSITYAGSRQKKTASCFFQISGWLDNEEHEVRTGHTVERYAKL